MNWLQVTALSKIKMLSEEKKLQGSAKESKTKLSWKAVKKG